MSRIYGRRYNLQIGNDKVEVEGKLKSPAEYLELQLRDWQSLRISFLVQHEIGGYVSYAEINIYNLNRDSQDAIFGKYKSVVLSAGYEEMSGLIFKGEIVNVQNIPAGSSGTKGIKIFCRSSAEAVRFITVNQALGKGSSAYDVLRSCAEPIGNPVLFSGDFSDLPKRSRGTVLQGNPVTILDSLMKDFDFTWAIENGITKIIRNGYQVDGEMFVFSSTTGMIGSPVVTDTEISVRVALNAVVQLGRKIKIESIAPEFAFSDAYFTNIPRSIGEGVYEVRRIVHVGDSHGQVWESQLNCLRIDAAAREAIAQRISQ